MATPRPRLQAIRLTDAAADRIKYVMANAVQPVVGVRVGVKNGGCAGMAYTMEYAEAIAPADEVVEDKGVRVLVDPKALLFLLGTEMDYKTEKLAAQFVFSACSEKVGTGFSPVACGLVCSCACSNRKTGSHFFGTCAVSPDDIRELFSTFGPVDVRRMFGGAAIFADGTMFALVHEGVIYLKAGETNTAAFDREKLAPFTYATKDGKRGVMSYRRMPDRLYDDPDELAEWARGALAAARQGAVKKKPSTGVRKRMKK